MITEHDDKISPNNNEQNISAIFLVIVIVLMRYNALPAAVLRVLLGEVNHCLSISTGLVTDCFLSHSALRLTARCTKSRFGGIAYQK